MMTNQRLENKVRLSTIMMMVVVMMAQRGYSNDSEYKTSGNQLVPLQSKEIRLDKEVLKLVRHGKEFDVDVVYTLFNEGGAKETTIGFEAPVTPDNDVERNRYFWREHNDTLLLQSEQKALHKKPLKKGHEYIKHFRVVVNGKPVQYKVTSIDKIVKDEYTFPQLSFLYYFPVSLKHGYNTLHQTYRYFGQSDLMHRYCTSYIFETAKRWKGGIIGDFTLSLDMGPYEEYFVYNTFFEGTKHWTIQNGQMEFEPALLDQEDNYVIKKEGYRFHIHTGKAIFHQKNFHPQSALFLDAELIGYLHSVFNHKNDELYFPILERTPVLAADLLSLKILKALPAARRGRKIHDPEVARYYQKLPWYAREIKHADPDAPLTQIEKQWLNTLKMYKKKILRNLPFAIRGYVFQDNELNTYYAFHSWYHKKPDYRATLEQLTKGERRWRKKILSKKRISDQEFFRLFDEYITQYAR